MTLSALPSAVHWSSFGNRYIAMLRNWLDGTGDSDTGIVPWPCCAGWEAWRRSPVML